MIAARLRRVERGRLNPILLQDRVALARRRVQPPIACRAGHSEQRARVLRRHPASTGGQCGDRLLKALVDNGSGSALSEIVCKSACAFPTVSIADLRISFSASAAASFARNRTISLDCRGRCHRRRPLIATPRRAHPDHGAPIHCEI